MMNEFDVGVSYERVGNYKLAIKHYETALFSDTHNSTTLARLYYCLRATCDWEKLKTVSRALSYSTQQDLLIGTPPGETPFINITRRTDLVENLRVAKARSDWRKKELKGELKPFKHKNKKTKKKLTIGYLSPDLGDHPIGHVINDLFKLHDKDRFVINAYSNSTDDESIWINNVKEYSSNYINTSYQGAYTVAKKIQNDNVDILVDLTGHTRGNNLDTLIFHPAPIQLTYLGFPGSTGADFVDYNIVDKYLVKPGEEKYYSEKLVYMPDCYQINSWRTISKTKYSRSDYGIDEQAIVFASLQQAYKITPNIFDLWTKILDQVPNSILLLWDQYQDATVNLIAEAKKRNIEHRVKFVSSLSYPDHLARLSIVDIALDTPIYSGGATTSDCLYLGIPVVAFAGEHYLSRMSASMLHSLKLDELVVDNALNYLNLAVKLATDERYLLDIKSKIAKSKNEYNLFKPDVFTRNLEHAYKEMFKAYKSGNIIDHIKL